MNKQELTKIYNQRFDSYDTTAEYMVYRIVTWYYIIGYHDKLVEFAKKCKQYKSESLFMKLLQYGISVDDIFFLEFVITHIQKLNVKITIFLNLWNIITIFNFVMK